MEDGRQSSVCRILVIFSPFLPLFFWKTWQWTGKKENALAISYNNAQCNKAWRDDKVEAKVGEKKRTMWPHHAGQEVVCHIVSFSGRCFGTAVHYHNKERTKWIQFVTFSLSKAAAPGMHFNREEQKDQVLSRRSASARFCILSTIDDSFCNLAEKMATDSEDNSWGATEDLILDKAERFASLTPKHKKRLLLPWKRPPLQENLDIFY